MAESMMRCVGKQVRVKLNGSRVVEGTLRGYDPYLNLILDEAVEVNNVEVNNVDVNNVDVNNVDVNNVDVNNVDVNNVDVNNVDNRRSNIGTCFIRGCNIYIIETLDSTSKDTGHILACMSALTM
ncbi:hypothetical protein Pmani_012543 [Petrolisthes manimaculis]|uniref:Sm protein G n=1 Tax=Petrolisthes manimaculis TaxID=1843537 RepID=A0AAE1PYD3_9EUCA|nr:hypothetical protein Pmani_012543 [Petrolisthes manimaculis]